MQCYKVLVLVLQYFKKIVLVLVLAIPFAGNIGIGIADTF